MNASSELRKLAAIMFTDMVGYSALSQRDDKLALELLEEHRQLLREIFPRFNGTEIKTIGDAFLIEFHSALEAAQCAIEIQRTLAKRNHDVRAERRIELKIGIHIGDVVHRDGDVYGDGVNIASRIEALAGAGGICVSMDVERQIRNALEARFEKLAPTELKNISVAMDLFRIVLPWEYRANEEGRMKNVERSGRSFLASPLVWVGAIVLVATAIGWWLTHQRGATSASPTAQRITSLAVLPFENASGNADAEYLSDGMTETLISSLSQLPKLNVKARASVFRYKGKGTAAAQIAKELKVQAILNGRVVQRGNELSLYIELVDAALDKVIWSQQYNRKQADLVTLQSDIARDVSSRLKTKLSEEDEAKVTKVHTTNPEAYQLYLKGNYYTSKYTKEGFRRGIEFFNQAIAVDPNYALAYNGLAFNYINLGDWFISPSEATPKAKEAAMRALAIDDTLADAHLSLAIIAHWYEWDWATAEREFKRAIELNPNDPRIRGFYAWYLPQQGRLDEAVAEARRGRQLDPVSPETNFFLGSTLVFARQDDQAIEPLNYAIELDPTYWFAYNFLGRVYALKGRLPEAIATFQRALELEKDNAENWANLGYAHALSGHRAEAQKVIEHLKEMSDHSYVTPYNFAVIYAGLGDKDQAFAWLDRAYTDRSSFLVTHFKTDGYLDSLRSDPRFKELLKRMNLPE